MITMIIKIMALAIARTKTTNVIILMKVALMIINNDMYISFGDSLTLQKTNNSGNNNNDNSNNSHRILSMIKHEEQ